MKTLFSILPAIVLIIGFLIAGLIWHNIWGFNPISWVVDHPLVVSDGTIKKLIEYKTAKKFEELPGVDSPNIRAERVRLTLVLYALVDKLISDLPKNPQKLWVMKQFQVALKATHSEDTEAQEHFAIELEKIMDILDIKRSDGLISFYRYGYFLAYMTK